MAQETEASLHETEIALRRCQSLMMTFGITEKDLETSEFGRQSAHTGQRVPMHVIEVLVARLTLDYLKEAVERALTARRRTGESPAGRMAA